MILKDKIEALAGKFLEETDKFVMDVRVKPGNLIIVAIDGYTMVTIDDCIRLSKSIESSLDRDEEDFELRVTSYGADKPLKDPRQYGKHIGRELDITKTDGTFVKGKLLETSENEILIQESDGKKKSAGQEKNWKILHSEIKEAKIILSFK
jgi:ribosome maturation factor RimP